MKIIIWIHLLNKSSISVWGNIVDLDTYLYSMGMTAFFAIYYDLQDMRAIREYSHVILIYEV